MSPTTICAGGGQLDILGSGFASGASVTLGTVSANPVGFVSSSELHATFGITGLNPGTAYDVTVTNPDKSASTLSAAVTALAGPTPFFVDPPAAWNGTAMTLTVYLSTAASGIQNVAIQQHSATTPNPNPIVNLTNVSPVTGHPDQVQAVLPAGTAAGNYDVIVADASCPASVMNGLSIVANTDITLTGITPTVGDQTDPTTVQITAGTGFTPTPSVYISLHGSSTPATALQAVTFQSATALSAIVPVTSPTLSVGDYDVIVVDPIDAQGNTHVGVITGSTTTGYHVVASSPPTISDVTPRSLANTLTVPLTVVGTGFIGSGNAQSHVTLSCNVGGNISTFTGTVTSNTGTQLSATLPNAPAAGSVCTVRVTNGSPTDPAAPYAEFASIGITTTSGNLAGWLCSAPNITNCPQDTSTAKLGTARRAVQLVEGRVTPTQSFLYAIGGDTGDKGGALATVESSSLDVWGGMGAFRAERNAMVDKRTFFGAARVGQFIYAAGGYDGTAALRTIERAMILSPQDVPSQPDFDLAPSTTGLGVGTWTYRISAVRPSSDPSNPGGETLASDPLNVILPDLTTSAPATPKVAVTLSWPKMQNVASYNVYRTSTADTSQVYLLGNVAQPTSSTVSFVDTGASTTNPTPLPTGSLGVWTVVTADNTSTGTKITLGADRVGGAVAVAHAGMANSTTDVWWLYVGGGADASWGSLQSGYELAKVSIDTTTGVQTVGAFTAGSKTFASGRTLLSMWSVDSTDVLSIPTGTTYIYFGDGASGVTDTTNTSFAVSGTTSAAASGVVASTTNGDLGTLTSVSSPRAAGAAPVTVPGYLFDFGKLPTSSAFVSAPIQTPPTLGTWNNGAGLPVARALAGAAVENASIYVVGGTLDTNGITPEASVVRTVW